MADLTYRSPKTEVRASPIHGQGLFARIAVGAGEIVAVKGGHVLTHAQWAALEPSLGAAEIQIAEDLFIAPVREDHRPGDVAPGEELTIDRATTDDGDHELACRSGSPRCRGVVTGKDWMKPELQARYRGWFCWFLQRKIDAARRSAARPGEPPP